MAARREHNTDLLGLSGYPSSSEDENDESLLNTAQDWQQPQTQTPRDREMIREHDVRDDLRMPRNSVSDRVLNLASLLSSQGSYWHENGTGRHGNARPMLRARRRMADVGMSFAHRGIFRDPAMFEARSVVHDTVPELSEPPPRPSAAADIQSIMEFRRLAYRGPNMPPRPLGFQIPQQLPSSRSRRNQVLAGYGRNSILASVGSMYGEMRRVGRRVIAAHTQTASPSAAPSSANAPLLSPAAAPAPAAPYMTAPARVSAHLLAASPSPPPVQEREDMDADDNDNNNHHFEEDNAQFQRLSPRLINEPSPEDNNSDNIEAEESAARVNSPTVEEPGDEPIDEPGEISVDESLDIPIQDMADESADEQADMPVDEPGDRPANSVADEPSNRPTVEPGNRPNDEPSDMPADEPGDRPVNGDDDCALVSIDTSGSALVLRDNSNSLEESTADVSLVSLTQSRRNKRKRESYEANPNNEPSDVMEFNEKLLRLLECPVCLEWMEPPMWQCRRGHLVCGRCRTRLAACPVCRSGFSSVRNRAMEGMSELLRYPCRHGCGRYARLRRRAAHEASCSARCYRCPAPACAPAPPFPLATLTEHVQTTHAAMIKMGLKHKFSVKLNSQLHEDWILMTDSGLFHLRLEVELRNWGIVLFVVYIGPKCLSKEYSYEVTIVGQHNGRKLVYSRMAHSDLECTSMNVTRQDCFHLTMDQAVNYLRVRNKSCERDRSLDVTVEITKRVIGLADNSSVIASD